MKKHVVELCLVVLLALFVSIGTGHAETEDTSELHEYLGISFADATPQEVKQILLESKGITLDDKSKAYGVKDFGYELILQADFNENLIGVNRVLLSSAQPARMSAEEFPVRIRSDLAQFLDMEAQLTGLYGQPDKRLFYTNSDHYPVSNARFMFPSGVWELEPMLDVCEKDELLSAHSVWGNVELRVWIDSRETSKTRYLSRVMLYYWDSVMDSFAEINEFPPHEGGGTAGGDAP